MVVPYFARKYVLKAEPGVVAITGGDATLKVGGKAVAEFAYDRQVCSKYLSDGELPGHLAALAERWETLVSWEKQPIEAALRALAEERGLKAGVLIHPTRMALSGVAVGPPLFDLVELMGRETVLQHLRNFAGFLRTGELAPQS